MGSPSPSPSFYPDDARAVDTLERIFGGKARKPPKHGNKQMVSAKLSEVAVLGLRQIAKELGYMHAGNGNVSMLLESIGTRTVEVTVPPLVPHHLE